MITYYVHLVSNVFWLSACDGDDQSHIKMMKRESSVCVCLCVCVCVCVEGGGGICGHVLAYARVRARSCVSVKPSQSSILPTIH